MLIGICKLCQKKKQLLRHSHIFPEFMYGELFDEHHQLRRVRVDDIPSDNPRIDRPSSGEYEDGILCAQCDNKIIGQYETYASQVLYSQESLPADIQPHCTNYSEATICENIDYNRIKLFILSLLWRASISSRPLFAEIKLDEFEDPIRNMIISGNPGNINEFPIIIFTWLHDKNVPTDMILQPSIAGEGNDRRFVLVIGGVVYNIFVILNPIPKSIHEFILQPNKCSFLKLPEGSGWEFILKYHNR